SKAAIDASPFSHAPWRTMRVWRAPGMLGVILAAVEHEPSGRPPRLIGHPSRLSMRDRRARQILRVGQTGLSPVARSPDPFSPGRSPELPRNAQGHTGYLGRWA